MDVDPQIGVRPGEVLAGKYLVERVLGQGGMGVVVSARHLQLEERVALKFLLPAALQNSEAVSRFLREARAAVRIKSEYVARVSDVGQLDNGAPYMVMEYLDGGDLAAWLSQRGALPVEQAIEFVLQACVAVADAHALGIIHRDLKPANLFCLRRSDGQLSIKVLDFGISKLTNPGGSGSQPSMQMTKTASLMGTPLYMSPEQMRSSREVDAGTDIWALGAIIFELLAGRPAFLADTVTELAIKVANEPPPPLRGFRPDLPPGLEPVVLKCLEKDRARRFRNVADLSTALMPFAPLRARGLVDRIAGIIQSAGGLVETAIAPPMSGEAVAGRSHASGGTFPAIGRTTVGGSAGKAAAIGGGTFVGLAAIGGLAFLLLSRKPPEGPPPVASASSASMAPGSAASLPPAAPPPPAVTAIAVATAAATLAPEVTAAAASPAPPPPPIAKTKTPPVNPPPARTTAGLPPPAPHVTATATAVKPPANNCDPPYFFDARGNRTFKPECL